MTQLTIPVEGIFDLSNNQLVFNFSNISQIVNNQGSWVSTIPRQPTLIQKHGPRFCSSALGVAGCISLVISCVCSVLIPAIGSVGVIGIACLVNRKITPLHVKGLSSEAAKSQSLFEQRIGNGLSSGSLLDESVDIDNLPPPILPTTDPVDQKQPNIPPPPPPPPISGLGSSTTNQADIPVLPSARKEESSGKSRTSGALNSGDARSNLLSSIRNSFNPMQTKARLKQNPEKYPSNLLLKELKTTYERALAIGESELLGKTYFKDKVNDFGKNFAIVEQGENQTTEEMEDICKKTSFLNTHLKNMQWAKSLLEALSGREDLSNETRKHCSKKLESIDKHIEKLQKRNKKKSEEAKEKGPSEGSNNATVVTSGNLSAAEILFKAVSNEKFSQENETPSSKERTPEQVRQERYIATHGDGTSDQSDSEEWEP